MERLKQPGGVAAAVENLVRPAVEALGLRLWDVRFEKEGAVWVLKVLVDRDGPMDTDACETVSRAIDPVLDEADPISHSYMLEVGSPGLGRRLTRPWHFDAVKGQKVAAGLYKADARGCKEASGLLMALCGGQVVLQGLDGAERAVDMKDAAWFKLCDDEDLF